MQDSGLRRPYEPLLLARPMGSSAHAAAAHGAEHSRAQQEVPNLAIFAVPGQHSRKPHLGRLLAPHLPHSPSLLEVRPRRCSFKNTAGPVSTQPCHWCCMQVEVFRAWGRGAAMIRVILRGVDVWLQMFARELAKGWTSWGNEVLKFQTLDNFVAREPVTGAQQSPEPL